MRARRRRVLINSKIKTSGQLQREIISLKKTGKRIVFTNGCFDIIHYGHVKYLEEAKGNGDVLIVAINSDSSIKRIKGPNRPIIQERDRLRTIAALACVDYVVKFSTDTPLALIKALKPDILIKGADWNKKNIVGADFMKGYGAKVMTLKLMQGRSTSRIIEKIIEKCCP